MSSIPISCVNPGVFIDTVLKVHAGVDVNADANALCELPIMYSFVLLLRCYDVLIISLCSLGWCEYGKNE